MSKALKIILVILGAAAVGGSIFLICKTNKTNKEIMDNYDRLIKETEKEIDVGPSIEDIINKTENKN